MKTVIYFEKVREVMMNKEKYGKAVAVIMV
jgi:hypothetical protein